MMDVLHSRLDKFRVDSHFIGKGPLSVALHVTRYAIEHGLPISTEDLRTKKKGQVKGLGKSRIQSILAEHDISAILAAEAGRTSRGSLENMELYVRFLNHLDSPDLTVLREIEAWWIQRVRDFFAARPFRLDHDQSKSFSATIFALLKQAEERQKRTPDSTFLGTMLQHLVGAKLELSLEKQGMGVQHHGASVADAISGREGDFVLDRTAIHVTTYPSSSLLEKCQINLARGYYPIIITLADKVTTAQVYADGIGIAERVEIFPAEKFLAANLHELSGFASARHIITLRQLIECYNRIVEIYETDPSLRIAFG